MRFCEMRLQLRGVALRIKRAFCMCKGEDPGWMRDVRRGCGDWNGRTDARSRHTEKSRLWELLEDGRQKADGASAEDEGTAQAWSFLFWPLTVTVA
jgi:hypothetical protein